MHSYINYDATGTVVLQLPILIGNTKHRKGLHRTTKDLQK